MGPTNTDRVMTIANSIIGVSVLAMPFCFKQCGIILSILLLLISGIMTRLACYYLLKSAITVRRRNFEFLAFHVFGPSGKLFVELGIIGFMLGTCIAFFVVMGDLGPVIIGPALNIENYSTLRPSVLIGLGLLVVLPLGLLRNVESLSAVCAATVAFYLCLVLKVLAEATNHLLDWDWLEKVNLWRPSGIPQCIPIFSMALSCQTQLFEIFDSVPNTSLEKMNAVIKSAINMCTAVYISVGFLGYIAFCNQNFSGNLLMSFSPTLASEVIKMGFVLSVAVSFPLVIFPCRASLHSLLFRRGHAPHHELLSGGADYIPEPRFKCLTIFIVMFSLGTGLLIPSIEVVLGLVGSTIGIIICIMFPALIFICITNKNNNERLVAQLLFSIGVLVMILGTYSNLYATEEALTKPDIEIQKGNLALAKPPSLIVELPPDLQNKNEEKRILPNEKYSGVNHDKIGEIKTVIPSNEINNNKPLMEKNPVQQLDLNKRKEPPIPVAPADSVIKEEVKVNIPDPIPSVDNANNVINENSLKVNRAEEPAVDIKKEERIDKDAIKKEEAEMDTKERKIEDVQKKNEEILEKLHRHDEEQKKILEQQKALLEELKKQNLQQLQQNQNVIKVNDKDIKLEDNNNNNVNNNNYIQNNNDNNKKQIIDNNNNNNNKQNEINDINKNENKIKIEPIPTKLVDIKKEAVTPKEPPINVKPPSEKEIVNPIKSNEINSGKISNSILKPEVEKPLDIKKPDVKPMNLSPVISNEMVKGVPLPLAVKDSLIKNNDKITNEYKLENGDSNSKHRAREILVDDKKLVVEDREKRDLDYVEKLDKKQSSDKGAEENQNKHSQETGLKDLQDNQENNISIKEILKENEENCQKPDVKQKENVLNDNDIENNDKSLKMNNNDVKPEDNKLIENIQRKLNPVLEQEIIKTPSYLSNPEMPIINAEDIKIGNPIGNPIPEMKPMTRDLKSITNPEDSRIQMKNGAGVT